MPGQACLVIGANGLAGKRICKALSDKGIGWVGTRNKRDEAGLTELDITDTAGLSRVFSEVSPRAVFFCANLSGGVDFCEKNPGIASAFHLEATKRIGQLCNKYDAPLHFISTDYVFDGIKGPYNEEDAPNPLNIYGRLKLEAEGWIKGNMHKYIIARTTNVYGWDPATTTPNFIMQLYRAVTAGKVFNAPSFLWGNPTYVGDLANAIIELWEKEATGLFHIVGSDFVNRYELAKTACGILGLDGSLIREIKEPQEGGVPRPLKSNLNTVKFRSSYSTRLNDHKGGLEMFKADMGIG